MLKARKTQGKFPFYIGCAGHESSAAMVAALRDDDWLSLYYRDLAGWLQRTGDILGVLRAAYSRVTDPMTSGRNMPSHYSSREHHILPTFSEVGGLAPFAGGVGWAFKRDGSQRVIAFTTGDGGAATNDFNVLLRQASVHKLPVLITVWNNDWAIMTPRQQQWAGDLTAQVRAMDAIAVDVNAVNPFEVYDTTRELVQRLRDGEGPAFMHLHGGLLDAHSSSTDIRRYRTREEIEETTRTKDPVKKMGELLIEQGVIRESDVERIHDEIKAEIDAAEEQVLAEPEVPASRVTEKVIEIGPWQPQPAGGPTRQIADDRGAQRRRWSRSSSATLASSSSARTSAAPPAASSTSRSGWSRSIPAPPSAAPSTSSSSPASPPAAAWPTTAPAAARSSSWTTTSPPRRRSASPRASTTSPSATGTARCCCA